MEQVAICSPDAVRSLLEVAAFRVKDTMKTCIARSSSNKWSYQAYDTGGSAQREEKEWAAVAIVRRYVSKFQALFSYVCKY